MRGMMTAVTAEEMARTEEMEETREPTAMAKAAPGEAWPE